MDANHKKSILEKYTKSLQSQALLSFPDHHEDQSYSTDDETFFYGQQMDCFDLDAIKISQSMGMRRLHKKTQVFPCPQSPHIRNRGSHTMEVANTAKSLANILGLNGSACYAMALGHDLGHTPYGHTGEEVISEILGCKFRHEIFSVIVSEKIEREGCGLYLTLQTLSGMLKHSRGSSGLETSGMKEEEKVVMFADKISYIVADLNDARRLGYIKNKNMPKEIISLGKTPREMISTLTISLIEESGEKGTVSFSESQEANDFIVIRNWMYENFYHKLNHTEHRENLMLAYDEIEKQKVFSAISPALLLALLTDTECENIAKEIRLGNKVDFKRTCLGDIYPHLVGKNIFITKIPDYLNI